MRTLIPLGALAILPPPGDLRHVGHLLVLLRQRLPRRRLPRVPAPLGTGKPRIDSGICSARTGLLYDKSRYIDPVIPISFSYLKALLLASYLGRFCPDKAPDQCFFASFWCATQKNI